ncbi:MAG TPA: hypothetical protein VET90_00910, partial [Candidatus Binatus sp.]|nr:hypothetical protein [Candidatus Binatus sp.]
MPDPQTAIVVIVALATLVIPAGFLVVLLGAVVRRRTGHEPGSTWSGAVAFLGGASLGTMFLFADDLLIAAPLGLVVVGVAFGQWRAGRRQLAELLVLGASVPWTLLWTANMVLFSRGLLTLDPGEAVVAFMLGAVPMTLVLGALVRDWSRGRASRLAVAADAETAGLSRQRAGHVVARSFHTVGQAMREPSRLGPFGLPEVAALVALVAAQLAILLLTAFGLPSIAAYALAILGASAVATEAYLRAMAGRTRRSMEAFMWLGSWDLAGVRAATGRGVPTTRGGAAEWLARQPETPDEPATIRGLRVELNLLAGRVAEARAVLERMSEASPVERFNKAAAADLVAWWTRRGDATEAMAEAADEIEPRGGDEALRAEVALAIARVRHLAVAVPPAVEPLAPLLEVRDRLGARADGIVRRILWPRLYRVFVLTALLLAV